MANQDFDEKALDETKEIDQQKRKLLKKVLIGTAFTAPLIQSFSMKDFKPQIPSAWAS